jgi:hypothetical protein
MRRLGRIVLAKRTDMFAPHWPLASFVCRGDSKMPALDQAILTVGHRRFLPLLEHCQICPSCDRYFKKTPSNDQSACERGKALLVPVFDRTPICVDIADLGLDCRFDGFERNRDLSSTDLAAENLATPR